MKFSVSLYPFERWGGIEPMIRAMQQADKLGFAAVTLPEHLINPVLPTGEARKPASLYPDAFVLGAALAAATQRLRIHISALVVPYRHPLHTAKLAATLDQTSGGRLTLTVAAGWMEEEFEALGIDYRKRAAITDEYLAAIRTLWTHEQPSFTGDFVVIPPSRFEPRCVQQPHVPLLGGGAGRLALERVLRHCDGWGPMAAPPEELKPGVDWLRANARSHGRDPDTIKLWTRIEVMGGNAGIRGAHESGGSLGTDVTGVNAAAARDELLRKIELHAALGFGELGLSFPWRTPVEFIDRMEWLARDVLPSVP